MSIPTSVRAVFAAALAASCAPPAQPAPADTGVHWPTYLGDSRRAPFVGERVGTEPPQQFWTQTISTGLRGMPIVTDDVIIVVGTDQQVYTINRQDGSTFWRERLDGTPLSPMLSRGRIVAVTEGEGKLHVLELENGSELLERDLPSVAVPPLLSGDTIFIATEAATLIAVHIEERTDREFWRIEMPGRAVAGPTSAGNHLLYVSADTLYLVDRSGHPQARTATPGRVSAEIATDDTRIYATTERGMIIAWNIPDLDVAWSVSGFDAFLAGPALTDSLGYATTRSGKLVSFNTSDGAARILGSVPGAVSSTPTVVQNGILIGTLQGELYFIDRNGNPVWNVDLGGSVTAPISVHAGRIVVQLYGPADGFLGSEPLRGQLAELR